MEQVDDDLYIVLYEDPYGEVIQENYASAIHARKVAYLLSNSGMPATAYKRLKEFTL